MLAAAVGGVVEQVAISVLGSEQVDDLRALDEWLVGEPELRGLVRPVEATPAPGELGALSDALVAAVGAGGALTVLAGSLKAFLSQPRGENVQVRVTRQDGSSVELTADRVRHRSVPELVKMLVDTAADEQ